MGFFSIPSCPTCIRRLAGGALQQIRGKKRTKKIPTITVQLTRDVPKFGKKGTVLQISRGRMREEWFPQGVANYVTRQMLKSMPAGVLQQRDPMFMNVAVEKKKPKVAIELLTPTQTIALLDSFIPPNLMFSRSTIAPNESAIHGSVTLTDIATAVRNIAAANGKEGSRIVVSPENIKFLGKGLEGDKLKSLGTFDFEISMKGANDFVRRKVMVVKQEEV
ncbi:hypothetical protein L873DRAFT_1838206 [Choiromyces venosus 120613-1]|uniref:Ribosomal protein L9 domain-containing protein n=1 Tax=Choiromyces venosus 120613-1 TaxID=1336337 RepID=A0A3N4J8K5_9PEZI|nr:hypothetical protein L873DRAFT_1838206 [Choiromyces venosus 120613-1]